MPAFLIADDHPLFRAALSQAATSAAPGSTVHEAEDLESLGTAMTIVKPTMGVWPMEAPDRPERFTVRFEAARAVALNGREDALEVPGGAPRGVVGEDGVDLEVALVVVVGGADLAGGVEVDGAFDVEAAGAEPIQLPLPRPV